MNASKFAAAALFCAALLSGCGGGGSDVAQVAQSSSPNASQLAAVPAAGGGADGIVEYVTEATYPYGGNAWLAYERLNRNRGQCGFGLFTQNLQLDQAAAAHLQYVVANQTITHYETAGKPSFTGFAPKDRAAAAGYVGGVGEIFAAGLVVPSIFPRGDVIAEMLMDVPYHAGVALQGMRDVGIAYGSGVIVINPAHLAGTSFQAPAGVHTYPCDGTTEVRASITGEVPSPFPAEPSSTHWGPSISVVGHAPLRVTAASITGPSGAVAVKAILGEGKTKDPNRFCVGANACVIPQPLEWGTIYQVHLEGTDAGEPFTKDFSFSTARY